jgi:hypothetical protein
MPKPIVNATARAGAARARTRLLPHWHAEPRPELMERLGPALLTLLSWGLAAIIAAPLLLILLAPFLAPEIHP